jgi:glycosyltransferase involved in cell wall biosynthesis
MSTTRCSRRARSSSSTGPNLAAYVVTAESAARRFESLGVSKPWHVIPQGVALSALTDDARAEVAQRHRRDGELVVGYMAAFLLSREDAVGDNALYNVDHLLELWPEIAERVPGARLWLLGEASGRVRARVSARDDVLVLGRVPRERVLAYAANFDVALYPRSADQGIRAAKVAEYMGAGAPIVSYDYEVTPDVAEARAGILVSSPREFVDAVVTLAENRARRGELAAASAAAGRSSTGTCSRAGTPTRSSTAGYRRASSATFASTRSAHDSDECRCSTRRRSSRPSSVRAAAGRPRR